MRDRQRLCYKRKTSSKIRVDPASLLTSSSAAARPWPQPWPGRLVVVRGPAPARRRVAAALVARLAADVPGLVAADVAMPAQWPFRYPLMAPLPDAALPLLIVATDVHEAFVNQQTNATRLVTTQPHFLMQTWLEAVAGHPQAWLLATADADTLRRHAPEALDGRGPWRDVAWIDAAGEPDDAAEAALAPPGLEASLADALPRALRAADPAERLALAGQALDAARNPATLLAMASVCMEVNDLDNAGELLAEAVASAPGWGAAHFERGKWLLRKDDMPAAAEAFGAAARLMPNFASAAANWGATLGELDRPDEALAAFATALAADPDNPQVVNNVGVVTRELGRLGESEAAFRRVTALTPELAFGHYNLGHTLFLQGRYQASLAAYQAGQQRDPARNPVQASRLALAKLATGDAAGALRDLQGCLATLPRDYRRQVLGDTQSVAWALLSASPGLRDWRVVGDWLAAELART